MDSSNNQNGIELKQLGQRTISQSVNRVVMGQASLNALLDMDRLDFSNMLDQAQAYEKMPRKENQTASPREGEASSSLPPAAPPSEASPVTHRDNTSDEKKHEEISKVSEDIDSDTPVVNDGQFTSTSMMAVPAEIINETDLTLSAQPGLPKTETISSTVSGAQPVEEEGAGEDGLSPLNGSAESRKYSKLETFLSERHSVIESTKNNSEKIDPALLAGNKQKNATWSIDTNMSLNQKLSPDALVKQFIDGGVFNIADGEKKMQALTSLSAKSLSGATPLQSSISGLKNPSNTPLTKVAQVPIQLRVGHEGWGKMVSERVTWLATQKISFAELQLDPPELGPMQVRVNLSQDQASVSFVVSSPLVKESLDTQLFRLKDFFESQGMDLLNVDVRDNSQQQSSDNESSDSEPASPSLDLEAQALEEENAQAGQNTSAQTVSLHYGIDRYV